MVGPVGRFPLMDGQILWVGQFTQATGGAQEVRGLQVLSQEVASWGVDWVPTPKTLHITGILKILTTFVRKMRRHRRRNTLDPHRGHCHKGHYNAGAKNGCHKGHHKKHQRER